MTKGVISVRKLSAENQLASAKLQRTWRGYSTRKHLWSWGGLLMVSRVVKMQKVVRGWRGRKRALATLIGFHANCANRIKGSYFIWQAKKLLRILRAEHAQRCVLKVQCMYRMRLARAKVAAARLLFHNYMALKICRVTRGYLGRRRAKAIRRRSREILTEMTAAIMRDIGLAQKGVKITLETLGNTSNLTEWNWLECVLFNLLGVNRRDFALDIATELVRRFPSFRLGRFLLMCVLFLTWTCSGNNQHVREDYLEELIGILGHNKTSFTIDRVQTTLRLSSSQQHSEEVLLEDALKSIDGDIKAMPREIVADKTSNFESTLEEIEFMYFRNAFVRHGKSSVALSSMAACVLMRLHPAFFGEDPEENKIHRLVVARARKLLVRSKMVNTASLAESNSRIEIFEGLFAQPHRVVETQHITFKRCCMFGFDGFKQLHKQTQLNLKDSLSANVEVVQCGPNVLVIRASFENLPISDQELQNIRKRNHDVEEDTEMAPKWHINYEDDGRVVRTKYHIRPVVLQSNELRHLTELAIESHAKANNISEEESRQSGVTRVLSLFLLEKVRLVTCRSRMVFSQEQHELCSLRLALPVLDYTRREKNNLRTTDYSIKMMQRVFRGFRGKSRYRRLYTRSKEIRRQGMLLYKKRQDLLELRQERCKLAGKIQAKVRRFLWRRLMKKLHRSALYIQCCFRQKFARKVVAEKRRRRDMGPEVVEMLRRGITVGASTFTLIIYRCGDNYRMAGHDAVNNAMYEGSLHRPEVIRLIEDHNKCIQHGGPQAHLKGQQRIYIYNYYRIAELIASRLGLATAMSAVTTPLGAIPPGQKRLILVPLPAANPSVNNIEKISNLHRVLKDQSHVADRYHKLVQAKQNFKLHERSKLQ